MLKHLDRLAVGITTGGVVAGAAIGVLWAILNFPLWFLSALVLLVCYFVGQFIIEVWGKV